MQVLRPAVTTTLLFGLFCALTPFAATQTPPKPTPKKPAATAGAGQEEQVSPEEKKKRKDWNDSMLRKAAPKQGCFKATYPSTEWTEVQCVAPPKHPAMPKFGPRPAVIGNANDISAQAPSGHISQAIGSFDTVSGVTSEKSPLGDPAGTPVADAYTLQMNTDRFSTTACTGTTSAACDGPANTGCCGWQQFVHFNNSGSAGTTGTLVIQDWILRYNATCPAGQGWNQFQFTGDTDIYCWQNVKSSTPGDLGATPVDNQAISNLANLRMSTSVSSTGDSVVLSTGGTTTYNRTVASKVNAAAGWTGAEFNILGYGGNSNGGTTATFNTGAAITTRTEIIYGGTAAPNCVAQGFTAEKNNLSFGPTAPAATAPGPAVIFDESIAGGATSDCAAASTIGDTHLRTFKGLFYDFQAAGDFTLAEVEPSFAVQTRQVSGAPTWPNATVNKAVAARFGKTQVALCLAPTGSNQPAYVHVDGKLTQVDDGKTLELPGGVGLARQNNVYQLTSQGGDSVQATINPGWIGVVVGLGRWPTPVHGLIANPDGNVNHIQTRDGFVLATPFNFDDLYHRFADSWRVTERESMLSACNGEKPIEVGIPKQPFYDKDLEPEVRQKAQGVCTAAGVKPGTLFEACTLDVAVIGKDDAAKVFVNAIPPVAVGTITAGGGGILKDWWWLWLLLLLLLILILWLLRRKKP
ncbi:MAG TPA: hypothetical protein VFR84_16470 [Candidatus Angelobacter sp.]|nr:hypothetical protein [Candidatus Angelobacter sp.]